MVGRAFGFGFRVVVSLPQAAVIAENRSPYRLLLVVMIGHSGVRVGKD